MQMDIQQMPSLASVSEEGKEEDSKELIYQFKSDDGQNLSMISI